MRCATILGLFLASFPALAGTDDRVLAALQAERERAGSQRLERRAELDRVAVARARRIAKRPDHKRMTGLPPIEESLREAGVERVGATRIHVGLELGHADSAYAFIDDWKGYESSWEEARSKAWDGVGLAAHRAEDGWLVLVVVFVEDISIPAAPDLERLEREIVAAVNRERKSRGLTELALNAELAAVARRHSRDMAARDYFAHRSLEGLEPADRVRRGGIRFQRVSENLHKSYGADDPVEFAVQNWLDSPGHRRSMLDNNWLETGVGLAVADDGTLFATQLFMRRK